jgi:hypothetical protein
MIAGGHRGCFALWLPILAEELFHALLTLPEASLVVLLSNPGGFGPVSKMIEIAMPDEVFLGMRKSPQEFASELRVFHWALPCLKAKRVTDPLTFPCGRFVVY